MPKPKQMQLRKKRTDLRLTLERKGIRSFIGYVIKLLMVFFLMTCQSAARDAVEHLVLVQDPSDISPGDGEKGGGLEVDGWVRERRGRG